VPSPVVGVIAGAGELVARLRGRPTILNLDKWRESRAGDWVCDAAKARRELGLRCGDGRVRLRETAEAYRRAGWLPT
jgi:dihydroflavonol-4-reductase